MNGLETLQDLEREVRACGERKAAEAEALEVQVRRTKSSSIKLYSFGVLLRVLNMGHAPGTGERYLGAYNSLQSSVVDDRVVAAAPELVARVARLLGLLEFDADELRDADRQHAAEEHQKERQHVDAVSPVMLEWFRRHASGRYTGGQLERYLCGKKPRPPGFWTALDELVEGGLVGRQDPGYGAEDRYFLQEELE